MPRVSGVSVIWSPQALSDLNRHRKFLASKDAKTATQAIKAIRAGLKPMVHSPGIGRPVGGMAPEFREWLISFGHSGYIVLYRWDPGVAIILAIRHQSEAGYRA